jgi:glycerol-3-phosphate acyltransferase PlsY
MPWVALSSAAFWIVLALVFRFISVASILAAASLPAFAYAFRQGAVGISVSALIAVFVVIRHRANISRLLAGTEKRFERKKRPV